MRRLRRAQGHGHGQPNETNDTFKSRTDPLAAGHSSRPFTQAKDPPRSLTRRVFLCSPEGIRTLATALRGRRPRPLDDGARTCQAFVLQCLRPYQILSDLIESSAPDAFRRRLLGYQDSNLD